MLKNCLFDPVKLTKNVDIDKYGYFEYGIEFDRKSSFSFPGGEKGPTQGLEHTLTADKMYSIKFIVTRKKFFLNLKYNRANIYSFVNGKEIHIFKAKDSKILPTPLCLENISKDRSLDNVRKNWI